MLRLSLRRLAASTGGFSSAAFTGDDGGAYARQKLEQEVLQRHHQGTAPDATPPHGTAGGATSSSPGTETGASSSSASSSAAAAGPSARPAGEDATCAPTGFAGVRGDARGGPTTAESADLPRERPTVDTYRAMGDRELVETLQLRDRQIHELRTIYENFHYDADRHFRKMIFDYHDKTMQLSQVHGRMQQASLQINREALTKMRDEQEMMTRDKRIVFTICTLWCVVFWVWVRRHYVQRRELERDPMEGSEWAAMTPSVTGIGSYNDNFLGSRRRSARAVETTWERELRERREAQDQLEQQRAVLRNQAELQKAVAARREQQQQQQQQSSS